MNETNQPSRQQEKLPTPPDGATPKSEPQLVLRGHAATGCYRHS